jgi:hypothetical protein
MAAAICTRTAAILAMWLVSRTARRWPVVANTDAA